MEGFLRQVAGRLYREFGDDISSLTIVFPSLRARLFFSDALASIVTRPIWQPAYMSIDEVVDEIVNIPQGDHVRLMTELYKVYSQYHDESFDSFYFWGEMLLSDFDTIDKYLVDARMLFSNLSDLKAMEADRSYLTQEQQAIISRFWNSFGPQSQTSEEKQQFLTIWNTLWDIYTGFRERLRGLGMAYPGMAYRDAASAIASGQIAPAERKRYAIVGFNALSSCEKALFDHLSAQHETLYFWDYDKYYVDNPDQEAGLFLRENIRRYPQKLELPYDYDSFVQPKDITVVSAASDSLQCKYAAEFLAAVSKDGRKPGKETAIVLTDESLLVPLLYSVPDSAGPVNVTMGYPLRMTLAYSFVERLLELQARKRDKGRLAFYHSDVTGLLSHPFMQEAFSGAAQMASKVAERQQIYVDAAQLVGDAMTETVFIAPGNSWHELGAYLKDILAVVAWNDASDAQRAEYVAITIDGISKLSNSLDDCGVDIQPKTYASLLRKMLQNVSVPFEGEPLEGAQVMGILETRGLDFENVLLLSVNDDTFPGNRAVSSSFIPNNLRLAYGLPTPRHHEGVYAYYFYRLIQRSSNIHIAYRSKSDAKSSGEQSRYIYQLRYESRHVLTERRIGIDAGSHENRTIAVEKDSDVMQKLTAYTSVDGARLSPTSFYNFVACPLKFYFHSVARLDTADTITEEIDSPMLGSILHNAMQRLYDPLKNMADPRRSISKLIDTAAVDEAISSAIAKEYFHGNTVREEDYSGDLLLASDIVRMYINTCILPHDATAAQNFTILDLEKRVGSMFSFGPGNTQTVNFGGIADRIDRLGDGTLRVVDYKTGRESLTFKGLEALFSGGVAELNSAALQTFLYSMMLNLSTGEDVQPTLYYVRNMNNPNYSPLLTDRSVKMPVVSYLSYKERFTALVSDSLESLFDPETPFTQCEDHRICQWCDFNVICRR